jgi:hypothetical protein
MTVFPTVSSEIDLTTDNRLHTLCLTRLIESDHAVHITMIGNSDGALAEFLRYPGDILNSASSVKKTVFAV